MKGLKTTKRLLAAVLSLVMVLGMLPVIPLTITASGTDGTQNYVTLPITIRDFAADGMLFECNELDATGTLGQGGPTISFQDNGGLGAGSKAAMSGYNRYTASSNGMYITYYLTSASYTRNDVRYAVIRYRTNSAAVSGMTPQLSQRNNGVYHQYSNLGTAGYNTNTWAVALVDLGGGTDKVNYATLYPRLPSGKYIDIDYIAFYSDLADATWAKNNNNIEGSDKYIHGNTANFGLLSTTDASKYNNLAEPMSGDLQVVNKNGILGTTFVRNGAWGTSYKDPCVITLSNEVQQTLYGGVIRTDMVESTLGENGKPVYIQAVVDYVASSLKNLLPVAWANGDGSHNMWHIMGHKLEELGGKDLATCLREQIAANGNALGTYAEARAAFENGELDSYKNIDTYYEAAYFLLHNTFSDNVGYGKTVGVYDELRMIEQTDANGDVYYVFNSGYNNTMYDTDNGVIYNTQTTDADLHSTVTLRGNPWYKNRFDPLNPSLVGDLGYGISGDTYRDAAGMSDNDESNYYKNTNYHLSLEGHAEFIYHTDDNLYFTFMGDDDVYLYINGVRILDMGGAHAISKVSVSLNAVAKQCGLRDGEVYKFDFYYMERHGTAANFSIETNIKIVDPSMITEKRAWQYGNQVGYNGYVVPGVDVVYDFSITNNGQTSIADLTYNDADLGAYFSKDEIILPEGTEISDLAVYHFAADGSVKAFTNPADMDEETLKSYLTSDYKLLVGEKLLIYGVKHVLTDKDDNVFDNYVYTTAVADGENVDDAKRNLNGMDNHRIQKAQFAFEPLEFYDGGKLSGETYGALDEKKSMGVTITLDELLAPMKAYSDLKNLDYSKAVIKLTNASGSSTNVQYNVTVNEDGSFFFRTDKTGTEQFFYTVTVNNYTYEPISVYVHTYGVADSVYVLDYNLPVELLANEYGLLANDILTLGSNAGTYYNMHPVNSKSGEYGDFAASTESIVYTMKKFMNGTDTLEITIDVLDEEATEVTKTTGVTLTQTVTVVPANVMYYEDDFTDITYVNTGSDENGNIWAVYEAEEFKSNEQSADQNMNYGYDDAYSFFGSDALAFNRLENSTADASKIQAALDRIFYGSPADWDADYMDYEYPAGALLGDASNDTLHVLNVKHSASAEIFNFEFVGTGFEILSRTTMDYGVLTVKIEKYENGKYTPHKAIPVISESIGGDLTQIPLVVRKNMEYGQYKVSVITSNVRGEDRVVYLDGIRIYQPLTDDQEALYYKADEKNVSFTEIKDAIYAGDIVYGTVSPKFDDAGIVDYIQSWAYGNTMIEDQSGNFVLTATNSDDVMTSYEKYIAYGPNNEIYLSTADGSALSYIAFYVTKDENYVGERSIQVGAHLKYTGDNYEFTSDLNSVSLLYGGLASNFGSPSNAYSVTSGTEQYFSIDVDSLKPSVENGTEKYLVIIGTNDQNYNTLALTNLKLNGYSLVDGGATAAEAASVLDIYDVNASMMASQTYALIQQISKED